MLRQTTNSSGTTVHRHGLLMDTLLCVNCKLYALSAYFVSPFLCMELNKKTRMWANAHRDDRPAEHRWRPLFNATKFG